MKAFTSALTLTSQPGEMTDFCDRVLCGVTRVRPNQANGTAPTFDAATTSAFNGIASGGALTFAHTVNASAKFLTVRVHLSTSTQTVTGINWDSAGTPQAMFYIGRSANSGNCAIELWGLFNPTTGTKNVAITLSATGIGIAVAASYLGVGGIRSPRMNNLTNTTPTIQVNTWDNLGLVIDAMSVKNASAATAGSTQEYNATEAVGPTRDCGQHAAATGGAVTMSWTVTSGAWCIIALELRPTDDPSWRLRQDASGSQPQTVTVLPNGADELLVGYDDRFTALRVNVATALAGGQTLSFKYWNGTAWTAVSGLVDGSTNFTVTGETAITWTDPGTGWATRAFNSGPAMYYLQITVSSTPSTAPILRVLVVNWTVWDAQAYVGSVISWGTRTVYKTIGEDGATTTVLLDVLDSGTGGASGDVCSSMRIWESWNVGTHVGTSPTPTVAQLASGVFISRGSSAGLPNNTVHQAYVFVSRDAFILFVAAETAANGAWCIAAFKMTSYVVNDAWAWVVLGSDSTGATGKNALVNADATGAATVACYVQRALSGSGGSTALSKLAPMLLSSTLTNFYAYTNGADGKLLIRPFEVSEGGVGGSLRGALASVVAMVHTSGAALVGTGATLDTVTDPNTGTKYAVVRVNCLQYNSSAASVCAPWAGVEVPH